jgi:anthranilate synthase/aminodeoxychorismate synthase-like glutamine amidotransferase
VILVIDNFDSFTYNLVQCLAQCKAEVEVRRNNEIDLDGVVGLAPAGVLLGPGPCTPDESGVCLQILEDALSHQPRLKMPIFGVCLGFQAMGQVAGGNVCRARRVMHGKASKIEHSGKGVFSGMPNGFSAIRYHSLVIQTDSVPGCFEVTATSQDDGEIQGIRHVSRPIEGVQFHPESFLTEGGLKIIQNFVNLTVQA